MKSSEAMIFAVMNAILQLRRNFYSFHDSFYDSFHIPFHIPFCKNCVAIVKIAFITAKIIASLDFISAVHI